MKPATFALLIVSASMALRVVRQAYEDHPEVAHSMPKGWRTLLAEVEFFHQQFEAARKAR